MIQITIKFTARELDLLSSLAADQLFRREFIDSRLPGYTSNPGDLSLGKHLVERFRILTERAKGTASVPRGKAALKSPRSAGSGGAPRGL